MASEFQAPYRACPLCEGAFAAQVIADCSRHALWHPPLPATMHWMRCQACDHSFTDGYWTPAGLSEVFSKTHGGQVAGGDPDAKRQQWTPVVEAAVELLGGYETLGEGDKKVWLDVGFGDGALLMLANEIGFEELGLDARADTVTAFQSLGYSAMAGEFETCKIPTQPSIVSMMDVLEHIPYPVKALEKVRSVISPEGLLIISLPGLTSSSWRMMDKAGGNPYWGEIEHYHNFSLERLKTLLAQTGFSIMKVKFPYRYRAQIEVYCRVKIAS